MIEPGEAGRQAKKPTEIPKAGWKAIAKRVKEQVREDQVTLLAAGVAFYAMLGIFPAVILLVSAYGLVADPATVQSHVQSLTEAMGSGGEVIAGQLEDIGNASPGALGFGLIASLLAVLWSASAGMQGLMRATNVAYNEQETRSFLELRGRAVLLSIGAIVFLVLAIVLIGVVPVVLGFLGLGTVGNVLAQIARWVILAGVVIGAIAVVYRRAPDRARPRWRWVAPGAIVAAALWLLGSALFSFYVSNFGSYNETYGTLGGAIVLLLWLFLTAFVVLLGAEINAEMELQTARDSTTGEPQPRGQRGALTADETPETIPGRGPRGEPRQG